MFIKEYVYQRVCLSKSMLTKSMLTKSMFIKEYVDRVNYVGQNVTLLLDIVHEKIN